ncbi:MAG: SxtJ family membrane protein [Pirellulales bacterium]
MALLQINWNPNRRELRQFAALWVGFFGLIGVYCLLVSGSLTAAVALWAISVIGIVGWFVPSFIRPPYVVWLALAMPIGWTISHLLLLIMFYLVLTPIGLIMRVCGYDPLQRRFDRSAQSYWHDLEQNKDFDQYFKQF